MQTIEHLRHLFEYDDWANRQTISALETSPSDRSRRILAHLLITKQEYFERLSGKDSTGFDFWLDMSLEGSTWLAHSTHVNYSRLLEGGDESVLERIASYKTSEGEPYSNTYRELLTHVLIHSSIHRGNIMLRMREEGLEPPKIDYIIYLRSKE
jgi:uncharacterized damage-inducible protein DinB